MTDRYSKHRANDSGFQTLCMKVAHFQNLTSSKFTSSYGFSSSSSMPTINKGVPDIFWMRHPFQIGVVIIAAIKIFVVDFVFWARARSNKSICHQDMSWKLVTNPLSIQTNPYIAACPRLGTQDVLRERVSYLSKARDFIIESLNRFPDFSVIIFGSHVVDLLQRSTLWLGLTGRIHALQPAFQYNIDWTR